MSTIKSTCIEKKELLSGAVQEYACDLVYFQQDFGILRYTIEAHFAVCGIPLLPGDMTLALYWNDRPYTLYRWQLPRLGGALYYFNIADRVSLSPSEFRWRDLVVDVLIDEKMNARILDKEELPDDLAPDLGNYIRQATAHVLAHHRDIIVEAETLLARHAQDDRGNTPPSSDSEIKRDRI